MSVGQQLPVNPASAHLELEEQSWSLPPAPMTSDAGDGVGFSFVLVPQQPKNFPSAVGQHSPRRPSSTQVKCASHDDADIDPEESAILSPPFTGENVALEFGAGAGSEPSALSEPLLV